MNGQPRPQRPVRAVPSGHQPVPARPADTGGAAGENRPPVLQVVRYLASAYPNQALPPETTAVCVDAWQGIDPDVLAEAAREWAARETWFPKPAELRAAASRIRQRREAEAAVRARRGLHAAPPPADLVRRELEAMRQAVGSARKVGGDVATRVHERPNPSANEV